MLNANLRRLLSLASEEGGVFFGELRPLFRKVIKSEDGRHGTNRNTGSAIDALDGVDVEHFDSVEIRFIFLGVNAVDWAGINTCRVFGSDAGFCDYICHFVPCLNS